MLMSTSAWIGLDALLDLAEQPLVRPADGGHDAELRRPVAAVCFAASTSSGMSSQTARTGEVNCPDCEQKWQSSGQPPVFSDTMPSTSTSGPHHRIRTSCARSSRAGSALVRQPHHLHELRLAEAVSALQHLLARDGEDVLGMVAPIPVAFSVVAASRVVGEGS